MTLLRCPKFLRCLTADAGNFDRGHSLTSLLLPLAALSSLPTSSRLHALHVTLPQGRPLRSPPLHRTPCNASVGATLAVARPLHSLQKPCHCEASAHTGCGNPSPRPLRRGRRPRRPAPQGFLLPVRRGGRLCPPAGLVPHSLQKPCHCEPVTDSLVRQSVPPSPWPPCLKGAGTARP